MTVFDVVSKIKKYAHSPEDKECLVGTSRQDFAEKAGLFATMLSVNSHSMI